MLTEAKYADSAVSDHLALCTALSIPAAAALIQIGDFDRLISL